MKKVLSILLATMLCLCAFSAVAEETVKINDSLSISFTVPEGYSFTENWYNDILYADFAPQTEDGVPMILSVGISEEYLDRSIGDLSEEELQSLTDLATADFSNPSVAMTETAHGTKLILVDENSDYDEYAEITTVYQGYFITLLLQPAESGVQLTEAQLQTAVDILSNMEFVSAAE